MPYFLQIDICNWCLSSLQPRPILVRAPCPLCSLRGSPGWRSEPEFCGVCTLWRRGVEMEKRDTHIEEGQQQPKVEIEERYFDWQLSGLVPAEVVPPVDCYYQQKDFPIALAGTVSPLSPGGCYPIWEEMNRGPLTLYEVSVDRIFTEGAQWSKQALCQHQHLRQNTPPHSNHWPSNSWVSNWSICGICLWCCFGRGAL